MFHQDYVLNGVGHGHVAQMLEGVKFDPYLLRPYIGDDNRRYCTVNTGKRRYNKEKKRYEPVFENVRINDLRANGIDSPVFNAGTMLRKEEWLELDRVVLRAARYRLRAWSDLAAAASFGGFNGMGKMILEHETMSDPGEAMQDMDGLTEGRTDSPLYQLQGTPLPITHADFWYSQRRLMISRNTGTPLSTTMGEASARRVAELIEKMTIGNNTGIIYGGNSTQVGGYGRTSQVYGYTNFPPRVTKTNLSNPSLPGWVPSNTIDDVLAMRDLLTANKFYGPFMLYHSNDWDKYMDKDYILTGGNVATQTLRQRLLAIGQEEGAGGNNMTKQILGVRRLDFLFGSLPKAGSGPGAEGVATAANPFTLIMVQMTPDVAEAINGQDITTVQWESKGGLQLNFKVLCIQVARLRADFYNNCGICHGSIS